MNCSIIELTQRGKLTVVDQLADKTLSSKDFFENCFTFLVSQLNKKKNGENSSKNTNSENVSTSNNNKTNTKIKHHNTQLRSELYDKMNKEENRNSSTIKEIWTVKNIPLNMKKLGAETLANNVLEKLKRTSLIDKSSMKFVHEIKDILICSDAVIYEYLEPLLKKYCSQETNIVFMDNDCATLGAAFLASSLLKVETFDILPFSIGMGLYTGVVKKIINAKTSFPCSGNHLFQTIVKNQKTIRFNVYEGESPLARNCKHICEIVIENLRKAPAGRLVLDVQIEFNEYGLLNAYATDFHTKEKLDLKIHLNNLHNIEFKRDDNNSIVNIDQKLDPILMARDRHIASFLDDLDAYLEYLVTVYKKSPDLIKNLITRKVLLAKKFISKNRLKVSLNECYQIAGELEEIIDKNRPVIDSDTTNTESSCSSPSHQPSTRNHINTNELKNEINHIDKIYKSKYLNNNYYDSCDSDEFDLKRPYIQSKACNIL
jgi:molecular chaperone DnaK (HSP70)